MRAGHLQGRLTAFGREIYAADGSRIAEDITTEAKARRLVACWNACEGVPTLMLESEGHTVLAWMRTASKLIKATAQRDELLAALKKARSGLSNGLWDYGPGQDEHTQCDALIEEIDAAIAKAEGGAA